MYSPLDTGNTPSNNPYQSLPPSLLPYLSIPLQPHILTQNPLRSCPFSIGTQNPLCNTVTSVGRAALSPTQRDYAPRFITLNSVLNLSTADFSEFYLLNKEKWDQDLLRFIESQQDYVSVAPFINNLLTELKIRDLFSHLPPNIFVRLLEMSLAKSFSFPEFKMMLGRYPFDRRGTAGEILLKAAFEQKSPYLLYWISLFPISTVTSFLHSISRDGANFFNQLEACVATSDLESIFNHIGTKPGLHGLVNAFNSLFIVIEDSSGEKKHITLKEGWELSLAIELNKLSNESKSNDIHFLTLRQIPPLMIRLSTLIPHRKEILPRLFAFLSTEQQCLYISSLRGEAYCLTLENSPTITPSLYPFIFRLSSPSQLLCYLEHRLQIFSDQKSLIQHEKSAIYSQIIEYCQETSATSFQRFIEIEYDLKSLRRLMHTLYDPITKILCAFVQDRPFHSSLDKPYEKWREISFTMERTQENNRNELAFLIKRVSQLKNK